LWPVAVPVFAVAPAAVLVVVGGDAIARNLSE
jgi:hypothetical protein